MLLVSAADRVSIAGHSRKASYKNKGTIKWKLFACPLQTMTECCCVRDLFFLIKEDFERLLYFNCFVLNKKTTKISTLSLHLEDTRRIPIYR